MHTATTNHPNTTEFSALLKACAVFVELKEAIILSDSDWRVAWVNPGFTQLTGYQLKDVVGKKTNQFLKAAACASGRRSIPLDQSQVTAQADGITRCKHVSGRSIRSKTTVWALCDDACDVIGHAALIRDVDASLDLQGVMSRLYEISASQTLSSSEKIHSIMRVGCEYFRLPTARVGTIDADTYTVGYAVSTICDISPGTQFDLNELNCARTIRSDRPIMVVGGADDAAQAQSQPNALGEVSYIGMPLTVEGKRIGTLSFSSPLTHPSFSASKIELMKLLAAWVAQEIRLITAYEDLNRAATTDWLTLASTRRHFHADIEQAFDEFVQSGRVSSVIMVDIDHFKSVNDTYGHATGDEVLRCVADALRDHLTIGGQLYRVGGEEFALLLRDTSVADALHTAEHMRSAVDRLSMEHPRGGFSVSVSLGAATLHDKISDANAWIYHADAALYASKNRGRNRVSSAGVDNVLDFFGQARGANATAFPSLAETGNS